MADFGSLDGVSAELERLAGGPDPLVCRLPRQPGQKEERWTQLLAGQSTEVDTSSDTEGDATDAAEAVRSVSLDDVVTSLRADVDALREEVQRISSIVEELRRTFDL